MNKKMFSPKIWIMSLFIVAALPIAAQEADSEREMRTFRENSSVFESAGI